MRQLGERCEENLKILAKMIKIGRFRQALELRLDKRMDELRLAFLVLLSELQKKALVAIFARQTFLLNKQKTK